MNDAIVHFEKARQLVQEGSLAGAKFESLRRELYVQLGRAYELAGQQAQAQAVYAELERLTPK